MAIQRITRLPPAPLRPDDAHKGTFGRVLIVAGSRGMSGAACLAGLGALRGGAGLVYVAVPESLIPIVAAVEPSYLTIPLPEDENGRIAGAARARIEELLGTMDAVALGPGCGRSEDLSEFVRWLYTSAELPLVVDADGLNALAEMQDVIAQTPRLEKLPQSRVLTPHPGEFARLTGKDAPTTPNDRQNAAAEFAAAHGIVVLLKGRGTVITDGQRLGLSQTGNSGMATGGTGDVLTGLIAALLAQKMPPFEAAWFGAHLHGIAGDIAAERVSRPGMIASDVATALGEAWRRVT